MPAKTIVKKFMFDPFSQIYNSMFSCESHILGRSFEFVCKLGGFELATLGCKVQPVSHLYDFSSVEDGVEVPPLFSILLTD